MTWNLVSKIGGYRKVGACTLRRSRAGRRSLVLSRTVQAGSKWAPMWMRYDGRCMLLWKIRCSSWAKRELEHATRMAPMRALPAAASTRTAQDGRRWWVWWSTHRHSNRSHSLSLIARGNVTAHTHTAPVPPISRVDDVGTVSAPCACCPPLFAHTPQIPIRAQTQICCSVTV